MLLKRAIILLLCLLILFPGMFINPAMAETEFQDAVEAQCVAAAMSCWMNGISGINLNDRTLLWDMAGWFAALMHRTQGWDLLDASLVDDFLHSVGMTELSTIPEYLLEQGSVHLLLDSEGGRNYDFISHKAQLDAMLGINTSIYITVKEDLCAQAELRYYYENGWYDSWLFELQFDVNPEQGSDFAYRLINIVPHNHEPELNGELNFTWEDLIAANQVQNVLAIYPALCISSDGCEGNTEEVWVFLRAGYPARITCGKDWLFGQYHGAVFDVETQEDGFQHVCIGYINEEQDRWANVADILISYLADIRIITLDRIDGDQIWTHCICLGGMEKDIAFDRGTLVLREALIAPGQRYATRTQFIYSQKEPVFSFLDSWEGDFRDITLNWESYQDGTRKCWTETVAIPADWEYLPYAGVYGDYTVYMNEAYTIPYSYPGENGNYTLYLSTAKG